MRTALRTPRPTASPARSGRDRAAAAIAAAALAMLPVQAWAIARAGAVEGPFGLSFTGAAGAPAVAAAPADLPADAGDAPVVDEVARATAASHQLLASRARQSRERAEEGPSDPAYRAFAEKWSAQARAEQDPSDPATTRWAVLVGINEHMGSVRDNVGSAQDAVDLYRHLVSLGWREDHIVLITDLDATRDHITSAMAWLAHKTDRDSVAVFHYSGHSKKWYGQDHDGDGEVTDEGLWPTDDAFIVDSEVSARLAEVRAGRFWINFGACNARGFDDPGMTGPGRLVTWSSREDQKSYEDPSVDNSVWGYYLFQEGMLDGWGDLDGDGDITVEEAFTFAAPRAERRTEGQAYGVQSAQISDGVEGDFSLAIPEPEPEPEPEEQEAGSSGPLCPLVCPDRD